MTSRYTVTQTLSARPAARWAVPAGWLAAVVLIGLAKPTGGGWWIVVVTVLAAGALWGVRLSIEVTDTAVVTRMSGMRHTLLTSEIAHVKLRDYNPRGDFGGWGWRYRHDGARLFAMAGTTAVVVITRTGHEVYYGATNPARLESALTSTAAH